MPAFFILLVVLDISGVYCTKGSTCEPKQATLSHIESAILALATSKHYISTSLDCSSALTHNPVDCGEVLETGFNKSGVYKIWPMNRLTENTAIDVFCDMETDGGGWTVIQRRGNFQRAKDYFFKDWSSYKKGFGNIEKDFWLGNDYIYALTNQKIYSVRFDLQDTQLVKKYAQYDTFRIGEENQKYVLHIADYSGDAGDSMLPEGGNNLDKQYFSTKDRDNDKGKEDCAKLYKGGWWYNACHAANLNGIYYRGKHDSHADGVDWFTWKGYNEALEATEIKIRPKNFRFPRIQTNECPV